MNHKKHEQRARWRTRATMTIVEVEGFYGETRTYLKVGPGEWVRIR